MSDVTIVCCYNNETMYNNFVNTLKAQTCPYELIGIDNRGNGKFTSCAAAYNSVIDDVKTKYVIYSHQDILLQDAETLAQFVSYLERIKRDDILGVAGVKFTQTGVISSIKYRDNQTGETTEAGDICVGDNMVECDTLDECFFGGYTEHFRISPFNEVICDNWHLYAVEACLNTKSKCPDNHVYVCNAKLIHLSQGVLSPDFRYGFYSLCRYYAKYFPFISTTCTYSKTDFMYMFPRLVYRYPGLAAKYILKKFMLYDLIRKILH